MVSVLSGHWVYYLAPDNSAAEGQKLGNESFVHILLR